MMHEKLKYDLRKNLNNHVNKDLQCNNNRIESGYTGPWLGLIVMPYVITIELKDVPTNPISISVFSLM